MTQIAARYEIEDMIGEGAMGIVLRCRDGELGREVAVKKLRIGLPDIMDEEEALARFRTEARVAASLSHPNIVSVFDLIRENGHIYLVMEYVHGPTLREVVTELGPLSVHDTLLVARDVSGALAAAHAAGVIHRDVKPDNIFIARDRAKLGDFGLARHHQSPSRTTPNILLGTPAYLAPELPRDVAASPKSDVFAFALTVLFARRGRDVFCGKDSMATVYALCTERVTTEPDDGFDRRTAAAIDAALDHDPDARPTAAELHQALDEAVAARRVTPPWVGASIGMSVGSVPVLAPAEPEPEPKPEPPEPEPEPESEPEAEAMAGPPAPVEKGGLGGGADRGAVPTAEASRGAPRKEAGPPIKQTPHRWFWPVAGVAVLLLVLLALAGIARKNRSVAAATSVAPTSTVTTSPEPSVPQSTVPASSLPPTSAPANVLPGSLGGLVRMEDPTPTSVSPQERSLLEARGFGDPAVANYGLPGATTPAFTLVGIPRKPGAAQGTEPVGDILKALASKLGEPGELSSPTPHQVGQATYLCSTLSGRRPRTVCWWSTRDYLGIGIGFSADVDRTTQLTSQARQALKPDG